MAKKKKKLRVKAQEKLNSVDFTIYTDGGCLVNPGGQGGYGVVMINNSTREVREFSGGYISTTNNRMEIMAALRNYERETPSALALG